MKWNKQTIEALSPPIRLIDKHQAAALLSISPSTLKQYRRAKNSPWIEGIHYFRWNSRCIRYNEALLLDWGIHRNDPQAHQKAIEAFLAQLSNHQPRRRRRKS